MDKFNLVNSSSEKSKYKLLLDIQVDDSGREFFQVYEDTDYLLFYRIAKSNPGYDDTENQSELPINSIPWIKDVIINGFWRKPTDGGLPKTQHAVKCVIDNKEIIVSRTMNAEYGKPGFKIVNKSRSCHIINSMSQEMQVTDELLKSHLLEVFGKSTAFQS